MTIKSKTNINKNLFVVREGTNKSISVLKFGERFKSWQPYFT